MIDINNTYKTVSGMSVTLISTSGRLPYPVLGYIEDDTGITTWTSEGKLYEEEEGCEPFNLVEVSPYGDFKLDDPVYYTVNENGVKHKGHYAGLDEAGNPRVWYQGRTSWNESVATKVLTVSKP